MTAVTSNAFEDFTATNGARPAVGPGAALHWHGPVVAMEPEAIAAAAERCRETTHVVREVATGRIGVAFGGELEQRAGPHGWLATLPPLYPEWLGDRTFAETHGVRFPYVVGEMANGIATPAMVVATARAGALGFFGAAGLALDRVERGLAEIAVALGTESAWGSNLIHSPAEPELENAVADLYIRSDGRTES